jgi:hypothetical protein
MGDRLVYAAPSDRSLPLSVTAAGSRVSPLMAPSHLSLLGQFECVVDIDSEVADCALDALMPEQ